MSGTNRLIIFTVFLLGISFIYLISSLQFDRDLDSITSLENTQDDPYDGCIPTFADGGGPYYKANSPFREKISPEDHDGDPLVVQGRVLFNDCSTPVVGAIVDVWQADETGQYTDEWYRGRVTTDDDGNFRIESVMPLGYGSGTGYRPPHIHFKIFIDDIEIITSQMFFPEALGRPGFLDAYIMDLVEPGEDLDVKMFMGSHNIIVPVPPFEI